MDLTTVPTNLLPELLSNWRKEFPKRAAGGWWALSGFALQTSIYLLRFFQKVEKGAEPGITAEMEHLSDIMSPTDGRLALIQVKRTLTKHALVSAVEEAYLITDLCRRKTPALLNNLKFQIACQRRVTIAEVANLSMGDVVSSGGDTASWDAMLSCFDEESPITQEPDALDQLYLLLWNSGIRSPHALIERCAGRLLLSFGTTEPMAARQVGRDLADYFFAAERHDRWEPVGNLLTVEDTIPDSKASQYTDVLTGQQPRLEHVMKGFFRDRPQIFQLLWDTFERWVSSLDPLERVVDDKVPVFWIGGRSGEGKSVLLIQLLAAALRSSVVDPLLQLKGGDDLPRLVTSGLNRAHLSNRSVGRVFAVIDDIYDLHRHDRDEWDAIILNECDYSPPPVAIITCGPTEQKEQFTTRLSGQFEVTFFEVPTLSIDECRAFLSWYESRTGQTREWDELTIENALLVQLMFELAHGERIPEFARRFRKRLSDMKVFEAARAIVAVNALYMDAPLNLVTDDEGRDALEYLCRDEQLHFRVTLAGDEMSTTGVRLAHAHLAWLLFSEWVEPAPTTLAKAWARELSKSMVVFDDGPYSFRAATLLNRLLHTERLSDDDQDFSPLIANRCELVRELYRLQVIHHDGHPSPRTLARWLELDYKLKLQLSPSPAQCALALFAEPTLAPYIPGEAILWLWSIAESRVPEEAEQVCDAIKQFCLRYSNNPGVGGAIALLLDKRRDDAVMSRFARDWLMTNYSNPQAFQVLWSLESASPSDKEVIDRTFDWLGVNDDHPMASSHLAVLIANSSILGLRERTVDWLTNHAVNPNSYDLIAALVAADPNDAVMRGLALDWLAANDRQPSSYAPLSALVAANKGDADVIKCAFDWLAVNRENTRAYLVLMPLLATNPDNAGARERTLSWLAANESHQQAHNLLAVLCAASPNDFKVKTLAMDWLASNETNSNAHEVIKPLLPTNATNTEVRKLAIDWLTANETHPQFNQMLAVMIARSDGAEEWLRRGEHYLGKSESAHPETILGVLVTAGKADPRYIEMAFDFIDGTPSVGHRKSLLYHLKRALVRNFENAVEYLNGPYDDKRKRTVCASIALGMKQFPDTIAAFALDVIYRIDSGHVYSILWNVITRGREDDYLDEMIAQWLVDNYHRRGYGGMLDALNKNPTFWQRLLTLGVLPKRVVEDFNSRVDAR